MGEVLDFVKKKYDSELGEGLTEDEMAEGLAVGMCFITGKCSVCFYLPMCESDDSFIFPQDAPCMAYKRMVLNGGAK